MSAVVEDQPLAAMLEMLAQQADIHVYWKASFEKALAAKTVSADIRDQPLEQGVKILLSDVNHIVQGAGTKDSPMEIWLFPDSTAMAHEASTVPQTTSTRSDRKEAAESYDRNRERLRRVVLTSKDGQERERALVQLNEYEDTKENRLILLQSLQDQSLGVRRTALDELNTLDDVPLQPIATTALEEPNPDLQRAALAVLAYKFGLDALPTLEVVQQQARPEVRTYAIQLIKYLKDKY